MKHHIPGKDAALEDSIASMQQKLLAIGFHVEEHSWLNPVPDVWSVHIRDKDCPLLFTNGKGKTREAALASALGEFFERLSCNYFFADFYLGQEQANATYVHYPNEQWFPFNGDAMPAGMLNEELWSFYNPEKTLLPEHLIDTNSGNRKRGICAVPYLRQRDNEVTYFPVNIIGNLYVSNGMSAGNTETEARTQGLSEIFERWVKFKIIAEGICLPDIPEAVLARYPNIINSIKGLEEAGYTILVKDASLGGKYPVIAVVLLNPKDQGCYASFGAHPQFYVALERATTELLQGRGLDALDGFPEPDFDLEDVASSQNLETHFIDSSGSLYWNFFSQTPDYAFADWNFNGTTEQEFQHLCEIIHNDGFDIYISDYHHLGVYGCRILVPGMSEIYPVDDLEWDNNNAGIYCREAILKLAHLNNDACENLLDSLEENGFDDQQPVAALIGLAPDPGSVWEELRVGELKTRLALAINDEERILNGCEWLRHFQQLSPERLKTYRCIESLLNMEEVQTYQSTLNALYGEQTVTTAQQLLAGETIWDDLGNMGMNLENSQRHQQLLKAYQVLNAKKES
jgi:ribosomal protein S12 methylthiotransferase accessory factor